MYIVFEGIDGSGKTTLISELKVYFSKKIEVKIKEEPFDRSFIEKSFQFAKKANKLKSVIITLAFAYDRALNEAFFEFEGLVLSDRSFISSIAYQSLDLPKEWIFEVNKFFKKPDLVIFLDADVDVALKRIEERNKEKTYYEKKEFLEKIRKSYLETLDFLKEKGLRIVMVDANKSKEEVFEEVKRIIEENLKLKS